MVRGTDNTGLWGETTLEHPTTSPLEGECICDVAVIGGGFTGLSAALHLAEKGVNVAVVEAKGLGHGGSGRNVGLVNSGLWLTYDDVRKGLGDTYGNRLINTLEHAPKQVFDIIEKFDIQCESVRKGTLNCAHSEKALRGLTERAQYRKTLGSNVEILNAAEIANRTGTDHYSGALLDHNAGTIQPLAYAMGLGRAAIDAGAKVFTNSPVTALQRDGNHWRVKTKNGSLLAEKVLIAVGAYGRDNENISSPVSGGDNVPLYFFQCATEPLSDEDSATILPGGEGVWDTDPVMVAFRRDQAGRLILGSIGRLDYLGGTHRHWATETRKKLFPKLSPQRWISSWHGRIGMTGDHLPRLVEPAPGVLSIYGFNGRGIGPGTIFGRELASYCLSNNKDDLTLPISEQHSETLPEVHGAVIETGARLYHLMRSIC
jgi:glycine/D-amino acid oxidase-like deaminating enzyme